MIPRRADRLIALSLFLLLLVIYLQGKMVPSGDTRWYIPTALSMLREGDTDLDEYPDLVHAGDYALTRVRGHIYNIYPPGNALIAVPFLLVADIVAPNPWFASADDFVSVEGNRAMQWAIAALVMALTGVMLYALSRLYVGRKQSLVVVFLFAFGTSAWSTASRSLWQHGPTMLLLAGSLYLLLLAKQHPWLAAAAGLPLAMAYLVRPTNAISVMLLSLYVLIRYRRQFFVLAGLGLVVAGLFFWSSWLTWGTPLPPYYRAQDMCFGRAFWVAMAGHLLSPSRGLLVFSPVLILVPYGFVLGLRRRDDRLLLSLLLGIIILHWLTISLWCCWWGGYSYGPRLFSDVLPYLIFFLIPVVDRAWPDGDGKRRWWLLAALVVLGSVSVAIQARAALSWTVHKWNDSPASVDQFPGRLWDWGDVPYLRGLQVIDPLKEPLPKWNGRFIPNRTRITFGETMALRGWELRHVPGEKHKLHLILYWQALAEQPVDYAVFVHLVDGEGVMAAQKDQAPGEALGYPPHRWRVGDLIYDEHVVVTERAPEGTYHFELGVYNWESGQRLEAVQDGRPLGDALVLGPEVTLPRPLLPGAYLPVVLQGHRWPPIADAPGAPPAPYPGP